MLCYDNYTAPDALDRIVEREYFMFLQGPIITPTYDEFDVA